MSRAYIPPWRLRQGQAPAGGEHENTASTNDSTSATTSSDATARGRGRERGFNSAGRGRRDYRGRGSSFGFYQRRDQPQHHQQVDDGAELYHNRDIAAYFWPGEDHVTDRNTLSITFHDSKAHPENLSYVLLFHGANPRWAADHIIFAKSRLNILPGYRSKKAEHGEWETTNSHPTQSSKDLTNGLPTSENEELEPASENITAIITADPAAPPTIQQDENPPGTEATSDPAPPSTNQGPSRLRYTDIRLIPAAELYTKEEMQPQHQPQEHDSYPTVPTIDYVPSTHPKIAVFEERKGYNPYFQHGGIRNARFAFVGWFKVARVNLLSPRSAELVRMLQQKWERRDRRGNLLPTRERDAAVWANSLSMEWAVVKFERLDAEDGLEPPKIERLPEPELDPTTEEADGGKKSVNELLSDLRLKDQNGEKSPGHETPVTDVGEKAVRNETEQELGIRDGETQQVGTDHELSAKA